MHADVDDDARRPHRLTVEHPEVVARVVEIAQVGHQALGVESPALAVPRGPRCEAAPPIEQFAPIHGLGDLQVMTGHAFVVDGGEFPPGREFIDALRAPPTTSGRDGKSPHSARCSRCPRSTSARCGIPEPGSDRECRNECRQAR